MIIVRSEAPPDQPGIRALHRAAFGGEAEAAVVDAIREGGFVEVSLVAEANGEIVGHILFSRCEISAPGASLPALSLAPLAVLPEFQRQGIGSRLAADGLDACRRRGHKIVLVLGHPAFYSRCGFSADLARPLHSPFGGGSAWMAAELAHGALAGRTGQVLYPPPFRAFE